MSISREAGSRTKMAVKTNNENVDPIGACIGAKGARVQVIIDELNGEKIDIVKYSDNPEEFIRAALSPAEVVSLDVDVEKQTGAHNRSVLSAFSCNRKRGTERTSCGASYRL
ncbi:MAG: hypothetical protein L6V93_06330 [Clostridiales bacterium]|nr:MAG: hypothetical protein L6V93_06330 [Clostridiales bacterium]